MSQFAYPFRCRLNPTLFCISIYYASSHFDAFEVYLGWSHGTMRGLECRLEHGATFGHGVLSTAVLGSKITTTNTLSSPFPLRFAALFSSALIVCMCTWSSHNHRRHLYRLPGSTPLPKVGSTREGCPGPRSGFEYLQGWRINHLSGKGIAVFARGIKHKKKTPNYPELFLEFERIVLYSNVCLLSYH